MNAGIEKETAGRAGTGPGLRAAFLAVLRMAIGWHFLYEGVAKLYTPGWTSSGYLIQSKWIFSGLFHWMASHPAVLRMVDLANIWGLILIGLGLFIGLFTRPAALSGIVLLLLYYVANPPFLGFETGLTTEGNYLVVDKNLVELFALCVIAVSPASVFSLDAVWKAVKLPVRKSMKKESGGEIKPSLSRRAALSGLASLPFFGAFAVFFFKKKAYESHEARILMAATGEKVDAITSSTLKSHQFTSLKDLKGTMPHAKIKDLDLSRVILGGNLIGGWAHARDLIYVDKLVKSYHTDRKVFDTFFIAEQCGVNTILTNPQLSLVINKYWHREKGKIQFISDCGYKNDVVEGVKVSVDAGAHACYVHGGICDELVKQGKMDPIGKAVELARQNGLPAGIGAHNLETVQACVAAGLKPDFWVKTLHHTGYWSAQAKAENDNIWCKNPEETIAFMKTLPQPWIAFKTMAAGAIDPKTAFRYAFENGADFICAGMYDFQIVDDVNLACEILSVPIPRERAWMA